jgi:uncharacterized membrane protein (UPF0127 family)
MDTPLKRMRGLMFATHVEEPLFFVFNAVGRRENAIHSFFCPRFDAAFITPGLRVADYLPNIAPNNPLIVAKAPSKYLIEAPPNSLKGLKPGARLSVSCPSARL